VQSAKIIADKNTRRSKGFGFLEIVSDTAGNQAIAVLNGSQVDGREIIVKPADHPHFSRQGHKRPRISKAPAGSSSNDKLKQYIVNS